MTLSPFFWRLSDWCRRAGWGGILAGAALVASLSAYVFLIRPLQAETQSIRAEMSSLKRVVKPTLGKDASQNPLEELAAFYEFFPSQERMPDLLERIYRAASEQGVVLDRGDYQLSQERELKLVRYDIALPVKGGYLQVRKFLAQVLNDVPSLALEGVVFNRQRINDPQVDAQIRFAMYMRRAP